MFYSKRHKTTTATINLLLFGWLGSTAGWSVWEKNTVPAGNLRSFTTSHSQTNRLITLLPYRLQGDNVVIILCRTRNGHVLGPTILIVYSDTSLFVDSFSCYFPAGQSHTVDMIYHIWAHNWVLEAQRASSHRLWVSQTHNWTRYWKPKLISTKQLCRSTAVPGSTWEY